MNMVVSWACAFPIVRKLLPHAIFLNNVIFPPFPPNECPKRKKKKMENCLKFHYDFLWENLIWIKHDCMKERKNYFWMIEHYIESCLVRPFGKRGKTTPTLLDNHVLLNSSTGRNEKIHKIDIYTQKNKKCWLYA